MGFLSDAWEWTKDRAADATDFAGDALGWGADRAGNLWDWASDAVGDSFSFLGFGGGDSSSAAGVLPSGATTNVYCGGGPSGSGIAPDRRRYVIEGDFLLDTYQGRVWKYDSDSRTFARVIRELSETELNAVEAAHGIFEHIRTKLAERIKGQSDERSRPIFQALEVAAQSAKRDVAVHRETLAARASRAKRR